MKQIRILFIVLSLLMTLTAQAQGVRVVRGAIVDANGLPIRTAVIVTDTKMKFLPRQDGTFEMKVPSTSRFVTISANGYVPVTRSIDGSYMMVRLEVDMEAIRRAEEEARAQEAQLLKAEQERQAALEKARRDSISAVEKARKDAEAQAKAEEAARFKAEKERLDAIEKARRDSIATVEQARKEAEAQAKAEEAAKVKAAKKEARQQKDAAYDERFRNKGLEHSIDVQYSYPLSKCQVFYKYSGLREYGNLHPFELDYTISWRFNRMVSLGVGAGALFHAKSITIKNDQFDPAYGNFKESRWDVPVFATVKFTPLRTRVRPLVSGSGGYYILSKTVLWEGGVGVDIRASRRVAAHLLLSVRSTPYPYFINEDPQSSGYKGAISPAVKLGISF